jgi:trimeric autotransporter adhesin
MSMKASERNPKGSSMPVKERLFCFSLLAGVMLGSCADPKGLEGIPQNDTLYALPAGVNAEVRDTFQLGAQRVKGGMSTNVSDKVTWTSSDASVVTVDSTGKAMATGIGAATISTIYEGFAAAVNAKVVGRITSAEVEAASIIIAKGTIYKLGTIGIVEDMSKRALPSAQAWGSSNPAVAAVLSDGTVAATGAGTATISLAYKGISYPRNVTVVDLPLDSVTMTSNNGTSVPTGMRTTFKVVGSFGGAMTQDISNLFTASLSIEDSEFASTAGTAVIANGLPTGATEKTVVATIAGAKLSIAETFKQDFPITIVDAKSLSSLAIAGVPPSVPVNGEPFTPTFKGTYGSVEFNTTAPTLSFKGPTSDDKTKYVEIITGSVYPRIAGTVSIVGTVSVSVAGQSTPKQVTASADTEIVNAPFSGVKLASAEMPPTTTVNVDKTIRFSATADYGSLMQTVTSAVVWVSSDPSIAIVSNATGSFGGPGRVTGVSPGGPIDIQAYYLGKLAATIPVTVEP